MAKGKPVFKGSTYRRCGCKGPATDDAGKPEFAADGQPKLRVLGDSCPELRKRDHGSWYYYVELPPGPDGKRRRPRKGGFVSKTKAEEEATKLWLLAHDGVDVLSDETVEDFLRRYHAERTDLKRSTHNDYGDYIERVYIPYFGKLKMRDMGIAPVKAMFRGIAEQNVVHKKNQDAADAALAAERAAHAAWKAGGPRKDPALRATWKAAQAELKAARAKPRHITGPGTQLKLKNTLSGAFKAAMAEGLIAENFTVGIVLPKYIRPKPLVWTAAREKAYRETGKIPGPVMVWTPEQAGHFLDLVTGHRLYPFFHLMAFRGPRRGEALGLGWAETDLEVHGTVNIIEQLVTDSVEVWEDTPKSESGDRTITLDSETWRLLLAWRQRQQAEREEWERDGTKAWTNSGKVFTQEDGTPYHPDTVSQIFDRLIEKYDLLPINLKDLRALAASLSLAAGLAMKAIQALLGHSSYNLTANTYTALMPQFDRANAEAPLAIVPRASTTALPEASGDEVLDSVMEMLRALAPGAGTLIPKVAASIVAVVRGTAPTGEQPAGAPEAAPTAGSASDHVLRSVPMEEAA
ncbi:tyrosine-type recombinase/integrase [Kitasatospora purpeofusca]|uniref:tyrosine-type recombinase/integrase n=1 Tax=Kitasatospora purpeofusca TaxID=67352 RepID=UPI0036ED7A7C